MATGFIIRIIKLITVIAQNDLYCQLSTATILCDNTTASKKILNSIPQSYDEILSRIHFNHVGYPLKYVESAIVSLLSFDILDGSMNISNQLVEEANDPNEYMRPVMLKVSNPEETGREYDTSHLIFTPDR